MLRSDPKIDFITKGVSARSNFEESLKLLDEINAEKRKLEFKKEWCEDYLCKQLHEMHDEYVFLDAASFDDYFDIYLHKNNAEYEEADLVLYETFLSVIKDKVFNKNNIKIAIFDSITVESGGYIFWYKYKKQKVGFKFPMYARATPDNFLDCKYKAYYYTGEYSIGLIGSALDRETVSSQLNLWLVLHGNADKMVED